MRNADRLQFPHYFAAQQAAEASEKAAEILHDWKMAILRKQPWPLSARALYEIFGKAAALARAEAAAWAASNEAQDIIAENVQEAHEEEKYWTSKAIEAVNA